MDVALFVEAQLPPTPARVLDVGCGHGDLAWAVARLGFEIAAIDPQGPERTAEWYLERRQVIDPRAPASVESCLADWKADHAGLHGFAELRAALDQRFEERYFAWTPYLHSELGGAEVEREERDLIEARKIRPLGFNYVGETGASG